MALIGVAFAPLYIKYLGVEAYGLIGIFAVLQAWLTLLDMGMTPTLNREVARYTAGAYSATAIRDLVRTFEIVCCGMAVLIATILFAASDWIADDWLHARALPAGHIAPFLAVVGVGAVLLFVGRLYPGGLLGLQEPLWLATL